DHLVDKRSECICRCSKSGIEMRGISGREGHSGAHFPHKSSVHEATDIRRGSPQ
ncbi:MAG: hypothetical protein QOK08_1372, partial [Actinomycetota bacterium]|nr:hypothetical protein [Actinomycetota bacterium]